MRTLSLVLAGLGVLGLTVLAEAQVAGRYIRIEAPASPQFSIYEIEVWSEGENIALNNREARFTGLGYRGRDINFRNEARQFINGQVDRSKRAINVGTAEGVNPWVELDLGDEHTLSRLAVMQPQQPHYADRSLRLVTVLDAGRRVVFTQSFDIREPPYNSGTAAWDLTPQTGPLAGKTIPPGTRSWAPLGEILAAQPQPAPPDAADRAARFAQRNTPAELERLSRAFFARMDLTKPELAAARQAYQQGNHTAALEAYRDHFFRKLAAIEFLSNRPPPTQPYEAAADDLLENIAVVFSRYDAVAETITPGTINWADLPGDDSGAIDLARVRARAGAFQQPLLVAYRDTGRTEYLDQWAALSDDWGINILADLDRAEEDLRFYFVTHPLQEFRDFAFTLAETAKAQPDFPRRLPPATLARLLIPVLEEYPPAYWWVCRRASFNHTYNGLNAATVVSRVLDDFHAGQRLDDENRQHWHKVWTANVTRDGSMNEIGDEGHLDMHWRMGITFHHMLRAPPPWFTDDFAAEFLTGWQQTLRYPIRHLPPDGRAHRLGRRLAFERIWQLSQPTHRLGTGAELPTLDSRDVLRHPEVQAILQQVYGAGRDRESLSEERQAIWDQVTEFYGTDFTPPSTTSDWMPYAGLHYLRQSWEPGSTFLAMICQPTGHPSTNGSHWNTEIHLFDYDQPLVGCSPVWVDGQPPFNEAGTLTYKPGSKTETLATASDRPIDARWHTSPRFDYAESWFEGTYQRHGVNQRAGQLQLGDRPVHDARALRQVILVRPARLVVVTDAVRVPESNAPRKYHLQQRFARTDTEDQPDPAASRVEGDPYALTLVNDNAPGVTVRRFTNAQLTWDPRDTPEAWSGGAAMMNHTGPLDRMGGLLRAEVSGHLLMSALLEPHAAPDAVTVDEVTDLTDEDRTGFAASLHTGGQLTWLATQGEPHWLEVGPIRLRGEGLLVWQHDNTTSGLMLGARELELAGESRDLAHRDFEFQLTADRLTEVTPILRPIQPVEFAPTETVFLGSQRVTLTSATPDVEIRYTRDGSEPDGDSPLYREPLTITASTYLRARAFRPGVREVPFTADGTQATVVSEARYTRGELLPAQAPEEPLKPGLRWERVEAGWLPLFSHLHLPEVLPPAEQGFTHQLLDLGMRQGDGPYGVRYAGYLRVPVSGVYTFHAPEEYVGASCEPGYDLRLWIDGHPWELGPRPHGRGQWSVPLAEGLHRLRLDQVDEAGRVLARLETPFVRSDFVGGGDPSQRFVVVQPGNSLWRIARGSYGSGLEFTLIFEANLDQIRDPDLIYPGQIFLVP